MLCYQGLGDADARRARADAVRALQGRRVGAGDHRAVPSAASPTTTTSGSRSTSTGDGAPRRLRDRAASAGARRRWCGAVGMLRAALVAAALALAAPRAVAAPTVHRRRRRRRGITFVHNNGAFGKKYLPETIGSGVAFLDFDGDGWQDMLLVNSTQLARAHRARRRCRRCIATITTARSPTSRAARDSTSSCTASAAPPPTSTTTARVDIYITGARRQPSVPQRSAAASSSTSPARAGVGDRGFSTSAAVVRLRQRRQARSVRRALRATGRPRTISSARSTARASRTARPNRTRGRARRSIATGATARSRT